MCWDGHLPLHSNDILTHIVIRGIVLKLKYIRAAPEVRFWRLVEKTDHCWNWTGAKTIDGYGRFRIDKRQMLPHRWIWTNLLRKNIPDGMYLCHTCDNPSCVNPDHLFVGTPKDNAQDRVKKGRSNTVSGERHGSKTMPHRVARGDRNGMRVHPNSVLRGSANACSKITEEDVLEIRRRYEAGETQVKLSDEFGINKSHVSRIILRYCWSHI
jgi:hypothetical protein